MIISPLKDWPNTIFFFLIRPCVVISLVTKMKTILNLMLCKKLKKKTIAWLLNVQSVVQIQKVRDNFKSRNSVVVYSIVGNILEKNGFGNFGGVNRRLLFSFDNVRIVTSFQGLIIFFIFSFSFSAWIGWFNPHCGSVTEKTETGTYYLVWSTSCQTIDNSETYDIHKILCSTLNKTKFCLTVLLVNNYSDISKKKGTNSYFISWDRDSKGW